MEINDIPISELESETARRLLEAGFLSFFDPLDDIIAAEIMVQSENYEECLALAEIYEADETYLGRMVYDLLDWCDMDLDRDDPRWETFDSSWE